MTEQTRLQYLTTASWLLGFAEGLDQELHRALIKRLTLAAHLLHAVWEEREKQ